jgi:two-component system, OmpR family, sensor kinase
VSGARASFPDRPLEVEIGELPAVLGDRDQLLRVVRNLITNSAVHTAARRPIQVRGFADDGGAVVTVADGGPGLPPEQAAHVFERFWRADKARTRARGGSGLGLSIVAAIVRAHGGTVRFDSSVESGSTVTVWLPTIPE